MLKKIAVVSVLTTLLTGCPAVVAGGAAAGAGGTIISDSRPLQTQSDDRNLTYQINNTLRADKQLEGKAVVSATVYNHVLLLTGQASTGALRARAEADTQKYNHKIRRTYNEITIGAPLGSLAQSNDTILTANIRTRLLATSDLRSGYFKIVTEDGVVYVLGLASRQQTDKVVDIISQRPNVKKVVKLVEYTNVPPSTPVE